MPHASAMRPISASVSAAIGARQLAKRTFATSQKQSFVSRPQVARTQCSRQQLQSSFRRSYADSVAPKPKKSGFRFLRWTWRATYLSAIAGLAWVAYGIVETRNPADQQAPDPSKKTLVVLGTSIGFLLLPLFYRTAADNIIYRYWLGICLSPEEPRH